MVHVVLLSTNAATAKGVVEEMKNKKAGTAPEFRVLVTGSRRWPEREPIQAALENCGATTVCHGDAEGADWVTTAVCSVLKLDLVVFPANWNKDGRAAGPIRNRRMFDMFKPDLVLAFPMKDSVGTYDMIGYAESRGCPVIIEEKFLKVEGTVKKGKKR